MRPVLLLVFAILFGLTAVFHLVALVDPSLGRGAPAWRHALFAAINAACAVGFVRRPRWFALPFAALVAQQLWSHGGDAWDAWRDFGEIDWVSLVVIVVMPLALWLLWTDRPRAATP